MEDMTEMTETAAIAAVSAVLDEYFASFVEADEAGLRRVFHPAVTLTSSAGGVLLTLELDAFVDAVTSRGTVHAVVAPARVRGITLLSPFAAFAHVEDADDRNAYSDGLTLVRLSEGWRIVSKCWSILTERT